MTWPWPLLIFASLPFRRILARRGFGPMRSQTTPVAVRPPRKPRPIIRFNALVYSLDVLLPLLNLRQEETWHPRAGVLRGYLWCHKVGGWALTTMFVIGFTGLVRL